MPGSWWSSITGIDLRQGDLLPNTPVPMRAPTGQNGVVVDIPVAAQDLIVISQSCDLENRKIQLVALCPIHSLAVFEKYSPAFKERGAWERVRTGRVEGLHMLGSMSDPTINRDALVVDFREIVSVPLEDLEAHAAGLPNRWRLNSPFLEHFSQAFARFFMRVGLPSDIPKFN